MKKRNKISILISLIYCIPFVFLGMYGDKIYHTLWLYGMMIIAMIGLSLYCKKTKRIPIVFVGNVLSFFMSYFLTQFLATENWDYYFKAFPSTIRTVQIFVVMLIIQTIVLVTAKRNKE